MNQRWSVSPWVSPTLFGSFSFPISLVPRLNAAEASGDPLLVHKEPDNLFSLSLDCSCSSPQQVSCFCCAWKGLWFHFSCLPHLSWAGFVFLFILPGAEQPLPFTSLIFTPLFFPASKSGGNPTTQSLQKPSQTQNFCPPVTITHRFLFCIFLQL